MVIDGFATVIGVLRAAFLWAALVAAALCALEWAVRTRRISPFSSIARFAHRVTTPVMSRVERQVVRAGGSPASAAWWSLVVILIAGIVVLSGLDFVRDQLAMTAAAANAGPRGVLRLLLHWAFSLFYIALLVRVFASWLRLNEFGPIVRTAWRVTEPLLAPIRRVLPPFGMIDFSPVAAYILVAYVVEPLVMRAL